MKYIETELYLCINNNMKKLMFFVLTLIFLKSYCQDYKELQFSELTFDVNSDTTLVLTKLNNKLLNGTFKLNDKRWENTYKIISFENGMIVGTSKYYEDDILIGTTEFKNGMHNGPAIFYDQKGSVIWKINNVNGKKHGKCWFKEEGYLYFINGKKVSQKEFEEFEKNNKKE